MVRLCQARITSQAYTFVHNEPDRSKSLTSTINRLAKLRLAFTPDPILTKQAISKPPAIFNAGVTFGMAI